MIINMKPTLSPILPSTQFVYDLVIWMIDAFRNLNENPTGDSYIL